MLIAQYMILLSILFIIQFSVSVAALAIGNNQQDSIASTGWCKLSDPDKNDIQNGGSCFGFQSVNPGDFNSSTSNMCMAPGSACPSSMITILVSDPMQRATLPAGPAKIAHSRRVCRATQS